MLPTLLSPETSGYHGKVMKLDEAKALLSIEKDISLTNLERSATAAAPVSGIVSSEPSA